jgi:hypothetical protein
MAPQMVFTALDSSQRSAANAEILDEEATSARLLRPYKIAIRPPKMPTLPENGLTDNQLHLSTPAESRRPAHKIRKRSCWRTAVAYLPKTPATTALAASVTVQGLVCIVLEVVFYKTISTLPHAWDPGDPFHLQTLVRTPLPAQVATVLFESTYQVVLCLDAIRLRNLVQASGLCFNSLCILVFVALMFVTLDGYAPVLVGQKIVSRGEWSRIQGLVAGLVAVLGSGTIAQAATAWRLRGEFQW